MASFDAILRAGLAVIDVFDPPPCEAKDCHIVGKHNMMAKMCISGWYVRLHPGTLEPIYRAGDAGALTLDGWREAFRKPTPPETIPWEETNQNHTR